MKKTVALCLLRLLPRGGSQFRKYICGRVCYYARWQHTWEEQQEAIRRFCEHDDDENKLYRKVNKQIRKSVTHYTVGNYFRTRLTHPPIWTLVEH